jgi:hypothetical protein
MERYPGVLGRPTSGRQACYGVRAWCSAQGSGNLRHPQTELSHGPGASNGTQESPALFLFHLSEVLLYWGHFPAL